MLFVLLALCCVWSMYAVLDIGGVVFDSLGAGSIGFVNVLGMFGLVGWLVVMCGCVVSFGIQCFLSHVVISSCLSFLVFVVL